MLYRGEKIIQVRSERGEKDIIYWVTIVLDSAARESRYKSLIETWQKSTSRERVLRSFKNKFDSYDNQELWTRYLKITEQPWDVRCNSRAGDGGKTYCKARISKEYFEDTKHLASFIYSQGLKNIMTDVRYLRKKGIVLKELENCTQTVDYDQLRSYAKSFCK